MNAMAFDVMVPLRETIEDLSHDNDVRVLVLTGAGHGFCSGADQTDSGIPPHIGGLTPISIGLRAAINGAAIGGGFCLSLACDVRIASDAAYFRAAGINNGLTASELGLSYLLPRAIGSSRASEIMLTGRDVDAAEADRIGLVSQVVPGERLLDACYETAARIIGWSRPGIELTKRSLWSSLDAASLQQHMNLEGLGQLFVRMLTENFQEATKARKEKRPAVFRD
jgi:enoyl-CoA hydratase